MHMMEISNQTPYHIAQIRCISKISQLTSMARPEHIAELGSIQVSNHTSFHFIELGSD